MDFENDHTIRIMLSQMVRGKAPTTWGPPDWARYHQSFRLTATTPRGLATAIWEGFGFTPVYAQRRKEENFRAAYHLALDFDGGDKTSSLEYLMRPNSFCDYHASFAYSTPSSTAKKPKSRVVFIFAQPVKSAVRYRLIYAAIAWFVAQDGSKSDPQCKDPLRLYYGSPKCEVRPNWSVLTPAAIRHVVREYRAAQPRPMKQAALKSPPAKVSDSYLSGILQRLLDNVRYAPDGERHGARLKNSRALGGYIATGYFRRGDVEPLMIDAALANTGSSTSAEKTVKDGIDYGLNKPLEPNLTSAPSLAEVLHVR